MTKGADQADTSQVQTEDGKTLLESEKLHFDAMKHLTTLSSGSVLLLATFLEKFSKGLVWRWLLAATFGCFFLSMLSSVSSMLQSANYVRHTGRIARLERGVRETIYYFSVITYLLGIVSLVFFVMKNFYKV